MVIKSLFIIINVQVFSLIKKGSLCTRYAEALISSQLKEDVIGKKIVQPTALCEG